MKKYFFVMMCFFAACSLFGAKKINISPLGDDKNGTGEDSKPFATLVRAVTEIKKGADGEYEIFVKNGEYFFDKTFTFRGADFKGKKISIMGESGANGSKPRFIGGRKISAAEMKKVTDKSILEKIPTDAEGTLYSLDLKKFGIDSYGEVGSRGFNRHAPLEMEASFNLQPMTLAKYPNDSSRMKIGEVLDKGTVVADVVGLKKLEPDPNPHGATFKYVDKRTSRWADAPDAFVYGNLSVGWAFDQIHIKKINLTDETITLSLPHIYGVYSNFPKKGVPWIERADLTVRGFQVFNLIEELDKKNEYFIDRKNGIFYAIFPSSPLPEDSFYFSTFYAPILKLEKTENFTVKNIEFAVSRASGLWAQGCDNLLVDKCEMHLCALGASIKNTKNSKMINCKIYHNALGGAVFHGGDIVELTPSKSSVENCEFFENALRKPLVTPTLHISGVGIRVANCYFHDHPHQTLLHTGNDLIIENNLFIRCCYGASDMGVIYTYGFHGHLGNVIRRNFFSNNQADVGDNSATVAGVYVDEGAADVLVEENIFCRTGSMGGAPAFGAIYIHGGCMTRANRNVFIDCPSAFGCQTWKDDLYRAKMEHGKTNDSKIVDITSAVYLKRYPQITKILDSSLPRLNYAQDNKVFDTSMAMNGDLILRYNKNLRPQNTSDIPQIRSLNEWSIDDVKLYFGSDPLVSQILKNKIGIK